MAKKLLWGGSDEVVTKYAIKDSHGNDINVASLQTQIGNLQNIGRFLSLWNASTGVATSDPPTSPYAYKTGDYFRISTGGDRIPAGTGYVTGGTNYTTSQATLGVGDVVYYDGTVWQIQSGTGEGTIVDVQANGDSVVAGGIANITASSLGAITDGIFAGRSVKSGTKLQMKSVQFLGTVDCNSTESLPQTKTYLFDTWNDMKEFSVADFESYFGITTGETTTFNIILGLKQENEPGTSSQIRMYAYYLARYSKYTSSNSFKTSTNELYLLNTHVIYSSSISSEYFYYTFNPMLYGATIVFTTDPTVQQRTINPFNPTMGFLRISFLNEDEVITGIKTVQNTHLDLDESYLAFQHDSNNLANAVSVRLVYENNILALRFRFVSDNPDFNSKDVLLTTDGTNSSGRLGFKKYKHTLTFSITSTTPAATLNYVIQFEDSRATAYTLDELPDIGGHAFVLTPSGSGQQNGPVLFLTPTNKLFAKYGSGTTVYLSGLLFQADGSYYFGSIPTVNSVTDTVE